MTDTLSAGPWGDDYRSWLTDLKQRVEHARQRAAASANRELVTLYWQIGRDILERQQLQGWGAKVIDQLARDLKDAFPDMRGFSPRNLKYMRALAQAWPAPEFVQQPAAQLPWFHLCTLLDKVKDPADRDWYAGKSLEHGCREKNRLVAEYALRGMANPMGVAEYQLLRQIPASLESGLPSIDRIEAELGPDLPAAE
ncbi:DUF1016 N-terminal domain-containing protein [Burkholderia ubonensis]|uniref:YhcG N-terminal domain-containing protein n=1 Tax=Burkholderia ubonensis TaxID=101571 RepID=A0A1R1J9I6_9BURK|nr:DUF1016 N-terminal domain-containing protein [Burkholderia ubonensis]OMG71879.1 hypothetical protein BW685_19605 [Burkholderia ubonensis]